MIEYSEYWKEGRDEHMALAWLPLNVEGGASAVEDEQCSSPSNRVRHVA